MQKAYPDNWLKKQLLSIWEIRAPLMGVAIVIIAILYGASLVAGFIASMVLWVLTNFMPEWTSYLLGWMVLGAVLNVCFEE